MTRWREPTEAMERVYRSLRPVSYTQILQNAAKNPARFGLEADRSLPELLTDIASHHEGVLLHLANYAGPKSRFRHPVLIDVELASRYPEPEGGPFRWIPKVTPTMYSGLVKSKAQIPEERFGLSDRLGLSDREVVSEIGLFVSDELLPDMVAAVETLPDAVDELPRPPVPRVGRKAPAEGRIAAAANAGEKSVRLRDGLQRLRDVWQPRSGSITALRKP